MMTNELIWCGLKAREKNPQKEMKKKVCFYIALDNMHVFLQANLQNLDTHMTSTDNHVTI